MLDQIEVGGENQAVSRQYMYYYLGAIMLCVYVSRHGEPRL